MKKTNTPLIIEAYPKDYSGYPFITLIQYKKQHMLTIVDNIYEDVIKAYVLDLCIPEGVSEEKIITVAAEWYKTNKDLFPLSIEFSKRGMTTQTSKIYREFNIEFISRIIGPVPSFPINTVKSCKKRRRKPIPQGIQIEDRTKKN